MLVEIPNVELHENLPSGSRVASCEQTDEQTDVTKLIEGFRKLL